MQHAWLARPREELRFITVFLSSRCACRHDRSFVVQDSLHEDDPCKVSRAAINKYVTDALRKFLV
jgi:hypothetical protein